MSAQETVDSIQEINLSYLRLTQRMLQGDRVLGMSRLGLSEQIADLLLSLTSAQMIKFAAANQLLCLFRFKDQTILGALTKSATHADVALTGAATLL